MLSEEKSMAIKKGNLFVAAGASEYLSAAGTLRFLARLSGRRRHGRRSLEASDGTAAAGACCSQKLNEDETRTGTPARTRTRNTTMPTRRTRGGGDGDGGGGGGGGGGTATATAASPTSIVIPSQRQERPVTVSTRTNHLTDAFTMETATSTPTTSRGRRIQPYIATILILTYTLFGIADACSSRSTPKPRPPTPTPRPNITFHMYTCPPDYAEWYCLNGATCFTVKIVNSVLHNCLCANGYIGERCEFKDLDGSYLPSRQRVMLETASIAGGATIAVFLVVIICIAAYIHCKRKQKELRTSSNCGDTVDGPGRDPELRPFSNHGRSLRIFMAKNSNNPVASPSIEQTRMPGWNYPVPDETRMASINEGKNASQ